MISYNSIALTLGLSTPKYDIVDLSIVQHDQGRCSRCTNATPLELVRWERRMWFTHFYSRETWCKGSRGNRSATRCSRTHARSDCWTVQLRKVGGRRGVSWNHNDDNTNAGRNTVKDSLNLLLSIDFLLKYLSCCWCSCICQIHSNRIPDPRPFNLTYDFVVIAPGYVNSTHVQGMNATNTISATTEWI